MFSNAFQKKFRFHMNLKSLLGQEPAVAGGETKPAADRGEADRLSRLLETYHPAGRPNDLLKSSDKA